jgi:hypothetical protein
MNMSWAPAAVSAEVGRPLEHLDVDGDADLGELRLDDLGDLDAERVVVRPQGGGEAVRVAGLGQQLTRALGIVVVGLEVRVAPNTCEEIGLVAGKPKPS